MMSNALKCEGRKGWQHKQGGIVHQPFDILRLMLLFGSPISYPPFMPNTRPVLLRVERRSKRDVLLHLSACVSSFALMFFVSLYRGHKRWNMKLTILSDLLVGTNRILKTLRVYIVVSNHLFPYIIS